MLVLRCALPGRDLGSSCDAKPEVVGQSRETGRRGGSIRVSTSVDLDLAREAFDRLGGPELLSPGLFVFLLRVRQIEATFDSESCLLFSRLKVLNPNFFRNDDAFELNEPVLKDRVLVKEPVADPVLLSLRFAASSRHSYLATVTIRCVNKNAPWNKLS